MLCEAIWYNFSAVLNIEKFIHMSATVIKKYYNLIRGNITKGAVVHWPNRIYHCSGSGTSISENLNKVPTFEHPQQLNWALLRDSKHLATQTI